MRDFTLALCAHKSFVPLPPPFENPGSAPVHVSGADPGFSFGGGGGRKMLCCSTHITSAEPNSLLAGVQGPLKGPGSSRVVLMLSSAIWALHLSILIEDLDLKKKHSWSNFRGARACCACCPPPPWIRHCVWCIFTACFLKQAGT